MDTLSLVSADGSRAFLDALREFFCDGLAGICIAMGIRANADERMATICFRRCFGVKLGRLLFLFDNIVFLPQAAKTTLGC